MSAVTASIILPNFNNGRASSRSGRRDFLGDCFRSLEATLENDPAEIEVLVADDGSTDDSLATCREWARRTWRQGRPFLRLIELPHSGVVARVVNQLLRESRGRIICRLDGDVILHTSGWVSRIVGMFDEGPAELGVIGGKQLTLDGRIHSAGDWILHPRGYHHVAQGAPRESVRDIQEVDHVMGCLYCHRREVWQTIGDYDEDILRGQTIEFGLRARLHGWRCFCDPGVEFTHCHTERGWRKNFADSPRGMEKSLAAFRAKWGFDRLAPDLDAVAKRYAGTPLLWNRAVFNDHLANQRSIELRADEAQWSVDATALMAVMADTPPRRSVAVLGQARTVVESMLVARGYRCVDPAPSQADVVIIHGLLERHPNPVAVLAQCRRTLRPDGRLIVITQERPAAVQAADDPLHRYRVHELFQQIRHSGFFEPQHPVQRVAGSSLLVLFARPGRIDTSRGHFTSAEPFRSAHAAR